MHSTNPSTMDRETFDDMDSTQASLPWFYFMVAASQVAGIISIILIAVLLGQYQGGFSWTLNLDTLFNNHPLFMTLGMIFFYGDAILVYRVFRDVTKIRVKILHASLLTLSLIFSSIGLKTVFDSHNLATPPETNLKSLHSWVGLTAVILFGLQWVCGFISFLFPKLSENIRKAYMPSHKLWGKIIFILGVGAVLMGITEFGIYYNIYGKKENKDQRNIINAYGISVLIFAIIILYLIGNPGYHRSTEVVIQRDYLVED